MPASAFTWNIDFLHEGHVHPGTPITGVKSGTFTIPTEGHDFSGNTRYRITLTVVDSDGLTPHAFVTIYPQKVNLTFDTVPSGLTLYLDGIARTTPFVHDTLVGFTHTIDARNQTSGAVTYSFGSWSDGGAQQHTIVVPASSQSYTATYTIVVGPGHACVRAGQQRDPTDEPEQGTVMFNGAQTAGNTNIIAIGWNDASSNITSVSDSAGNVVSGRGAERPRNGSQPGDLLREEHRRGIRGCQHGHRDIQHRRAIRRHQDPRVRGPRHQRPVRRRAVCLRVPPPWQTAATLRRTTRANSSSPQG